MKRPALFLLACVGVSYLLACSGDDQRGDSALSITASYVGGSSVDDCDAVAVDQRGNVYLGCHVWSTDFPGLRSESAETRGDVRALVVKLDSDLSRVLYFIDLGGSNWDAVNSVVLDSLDNAYVLGVTASPDLPTTTGAFQSTAPGGGLDCFVAKLDRAEKVKFSTYFGGSGSDACNSVGIDTSGNIYLARIIHEGHGKGKRPRCTRRLEASSARQRVDPVASDEMRAVSLASCLLE